MSISFANKLKLIRTALGKSPQFFADILEIPVDQYQAYETGEREICASELKAISSHPECLRYTLWLMTDQTNALAGQIAPGDPSPLKLAKQEEDKNSFDYQFIQTTEEALQLFCQLDWFIPNTKTANFNDCARLLLKDLKGVIELHYQSKDELKL